MARALPERRGGASSATAERLFVLRHIRRSFVLEGRHERARTELKRAMPAGLRSHGVFDVLVLGMDADDHATVRYSGSGVLANRLEPRSLSVRQLFRPAEL